jgi:hypothetical protein
MFVDERRANRKLAAKRERIGASKRACLDLPGQLPDGRLSGCYWTRSHNLLFEMFCVIPKLKVVRIGESGADCTVSNSQTRRNLAQAATFSPHFQNAFAIHRAFRTP